MISFGSLKKSKRDKTNREKLVWGSIQEDGKEATSEDQSV